MELQPLSVVWVDFQHLRAFFQGLALTPGPEHSTADEIAQPDEKQEEDERPAAARRIAELDDRRRPAAAGVHIERDVSLAVLCRAFRLQKAAQRE